MRPLLAAIALLLLVRLPFLNQPIQGDDFYYLAGAQHAQIDPLHPNHARYVFQGVEVDMRGHPHPPLNAWFLAAVLALTGDINEITFHLAYLLFSVIAVISMWSIARRFSKSPLWATLFFIATPAFMVNGTSLESDLPLLSFWMASIALFIHDKPALAAISMALAALSGYQALALIPILAAYSWTRGAGFRLRSTLVPLVPLFTLALWQLYERATTGDLPVTVLAGYFETYNLHSLSNKFKNATALTVHLSWLIFPALLIQKTRLFLITFTASATAAAFIDPNPLFFLSIALGISFLITLLRTIAKDHFLLLWTLIFFSFALVIFFAGSARYLLPIAAPVIILTLNRLHSRKRLLAAGLCLQLALGFALAHANYAHWDGYRRFIASLSLENKRVWINGEWGMRYYAESAGALPIVRGQAVRPGDMVLSSRLALPIPYTTGGGVLAPLAQEEISSINPLRLIGLNSRSAYSTANDGVRPFDISSHPFDVVRADVVIQRAPTLSFLPMNAPEADTQIVSGVYQLESNAWRWASTRAVVLLKNPPKPSRLQATFRIHHPSPGRRVRLLLDGALIDEQQYAAPGLYTIQSPAKTTGPSSTVSLTIDRGFQVPGDNRELGFILVSIGFLPVP
jgi:4-amino-4-deoxy-L-arabinose transferase-like glycosyltransferase